VLAWRRSSLRRYRRDPSRTSSCACRAGVDHLVRHNFKSRNGRPRSSLSCGRSRCRPGWRECRRRMALTPRRVGGRGRVSHCDRAADGSGRRSSDDTGERPTAVASFRGCFRKWFPRFPLRACGFSSFRCSVSTEVVNTALTLSFLMYTGGGLYVTRVAWVREQSLGAKAVLATTVGTCTIGCLLSSLSILGVAWSSVYVLVPLAASTLLSNGLARRHTRSADRLSVGVSGVLAAGTMGLLTATGQLTAQDVVRPTTLERDRPPWPLFVVAFENGFQDSRYARVGSLPFGALYRRKS